MCSTRGHLTAVEYMFKKYIEKLRTHDPACPLCHRPFDEQTEVDELISEARITFIIEGLDNKLNLSGCQLGKVY